MRVVSTENKDADVRENNVEDIEDLKEKEREAEIYAKSEAFIYSTYSYETDINQF